MKNGLGQAVLVTDLLFDDGPHLLIADDFVDERCSLCCAMGSDDDMRFGAFGFLCPDCLALAAA